MRSVSRCRQAIPNLHSERSDLRIFADISLATYPKFAPRPNCYRLLDRTPSTSLFRLATETLSAIATPAASHSEAVRSALKRVGYDEARGKLEVAPGSDEIETSTSRLSDKLVQRYPTAESRVAATYIILRVHVEEGNVLDAAAIRMFADRSHVGNPDTCAIFY
jgi:hypothetical protein